MPRAPRAGDTVALVVQTLYAGGAERQWVYLGRELVARGFRVVLFAFDLEGETPTICRSRSRRRSTCASCRGPPRSRIRRSRTTRSTRGALALAASAPEFLRRDLWRLTRDLRAIGARYVACQLDAPNVCGGLAGLFAGAERVLVSFRNLNPTDCPR